MAVTAIPEETFIDARAKSATFRAHYADDATLSVAEAATLAQLADDGAAAGFDVLGALHDALSGDGSRNSIAERHRLEV